MWKKIKKLFGGSGGESDGDSENPYISGRFGLVWDLPASWELENIVEGGCTLRPPEGGIAVIEYQPWRLDLSPDLQDAFRHDLRLAARRHYGGLVECDILDTRAVVGIEKFATADSETGMTYSANILVPAVQNGTLYIRLMAAEGGMTGIRESLVSALEDQKDKVGGEKDAPDAGGLDTDALNTWFQDPYDPSICGAPSIFTEDGPVDDLNLKDFTAFFEGEDRTGPLNPRMVLRARSDDPAYDNYHPDHPLSVIRKWLADFRAKARSTEPWVAAPREIVDAQRGFRTQLPPGFYPAPEMAMQDGQGYRRQTVEQRYNLITICLQPDFPDCGRSPEGALAIQKQHAEWSGMQWNADPLIRAEKIGAHDGMYYEVRGILHENDFLWMGMYIPWGDISMEITVGAEPDDRARSRANLELVLDSLQRI